eukprot:TRINITY_DN506_c0_g3_i1.p1 TRINITY_DN506_c0_g3~~TRINITY_DN506_c0_g3_i1.p1  ORF type:complete len:301 (+),score=29.35 TRINITY_DN506_c0_g3_i1:395-1297(+)
MSSPNVILVTGANKGIGFESVRLLAEQFPASKVLLGTRSVENGKAAIEKFRSSKQVDSTALYDNVEILELDVTSLPSIKSAVDTVRQKHGKVDVLMNNAGILGLDNDDVFAVNLFGVMAMVEEFLPLLSPGATLVTVSSEIGAYTANVMNEELQKKVSDISRLSKETITELAEDYQKFCRKESSMYTWPVPRRTFGPYGISKTLITAYTRMFALQHPELKVVVVCPGYCATDLNSNTGHRTAAKGAESVTWPISHEFERGEFYQDGEKHPFIKPFPLMISLSGSLYYFATKYLPKGSATK